MGLAVTKIPGTGAGVRPMRMLADTDVKVRFVSVTWDNSYAISGESLTPADVDLTEILIVIPTLALSGGTGFGLPAIGAAYDKTNNKLVAINLSAGVQYANTTNLTGETTHLLILGY